MEVTILDIKISGAIKNDIFSLQLQKPNHASPSKLNLSWANMLNPVTVIVYVPIPFGHSTFG